MRYCQYTQRGALGTHEVPIAETAHCRRMRTIAASPYRGRCGCARLPRTHAPLPSLDAHARRLPRIARTPHARCMRAAACGASCNAHTAGRQGRPRPRGARALTERRGSALCIDLGTACSKVVRSQLLQLALPLVLRLQCTQASAALEWPRTRAMRDVRALQLKAVRFTPISHGPSCPVDRPTTRNMRPSDAAKVKWQGCTQSAVQMWQRRARSRCRCNSREPGPGADVG
jgi:hypothetical protein